MSWQRLFLPGRFFPIRLLLSLRKDFNLQAKSQSHLFTSEMGVNSLWTWRQTAAIPQDSRLNVAPLRSTVGEGGLIWCKTAVRKQAGCCYDRRTWWISSLFGPDKGQLCVYYVALSLLAPSTLKGRLNMLNSKRRYKRRMWESVVAKQNPNICVIISWNGGFLQSAHHQSVGWQVPLWKVHSRLSTWLLTSVVFGLHFPGKSRETLADARPSEGLRSIDFLPLSLLGRETRSSPTGIINSARLSATQYLLILKADSILDDGCWTRSHKY